MMFKNLVLAMLSLSVVSQSYAFDVLPQKPLLRQREIAESCGFEV
jgi:hypothetical protein